MAESKIKTLSSSGPSFSPSIIEQGLDDTMDDSPRGHVPAPGVIISGKYRVERLIARGGMGAVFAASHCVSGKKVALKWMLPALGQIKGARERFIREACATARIAHPNIVDIYDVGAEHGAVYLVMEYLRGQTLADRLASTRLDATEAVSLLMPAFRGVAAAHAHGVVHRDLKPDNIFLCCTEAGDELEPKVLDFGISKITSDEVRNLALTHSGAVLGTPYYMSPEQVRGARDVDARADVYAFGVILFEALAGQRPFEAETYNELILKIATEAPPSLGEIAPDVDPTLVAIIERAMSRDPKGRIGSVETLALMLEPFADGVRFRNSRNSARERTPTSGHYPAGTATATLTPRPAAERHLAVSQVQPQLPNATQQRARISMMAAAVVLLLCAGAGILMSQQGQLGSRDSKTTTIVHPAPTSAPTDSRSEIRAARAQSDFALQATLTDLPLAIPIEPEPAAAERTETTTNAALHGSTSPEPATRGKYGRAPTAKTARLALANRSAADRRPANANANATTTDTTTDTQAADAAPRMVTAPTKRAAVKDWDERLGTGPARPVSGQDVPAGRLDAHDFR